MNCEEMINAFLNGELGEESKATFETHFSDCPDCSEEMMNWETCFNWLKKTFPDQAPPEDLWVKISAWANVQDGE
ncbi:MAG: hypothetical protein GTO18_06870 [Anaerolineales bacterium]|nr:hypothetical protein [Anaerolineales bacterium]